jgi:hypothetical protein
MSKVTVSFVKIAGKKQMGVVETTTKRFLTESLFCFIKHAEARGQPIFQTRSGRAWCFEQLGILAI